MKTVSDYAIEFLLGIKNVGLINSEEYKSRKEYIETENSTQITEEKIYNYIQQKNFEFECITRIHKLEVEQLHDQIKSLRSELGHYKSMSAYWKIKYKEVLSKEGVEGC